MNKEILALTIGVAGSGKTTFVDNMISLCDRPYQVLCLDDIRLALGSVYNEKHESTVAMVTDIMGRAFMERKLPLIVDSTCTSKYIVEKWIRLAKEYDYYIHAYFLNTSFEICCKRRVETKEIPLEVLQRQLEQLNELIGDMDTLSFDKVEFIDYKP